VVKELAVITSHHDGMYVASRLTVAEGTKEVDVGARPHFTAEEHLFDPPRHNKDIPSLPVFNQLVRRQG
jgi:hypothetical protein